CVLSLCVFTDHVDCISFQQSPHKLLKKPGESAELVCAHGQNTYNYMYWYQQAAEGALKLIGHLFISNVNPEKEFQGHLFLSGDATKEGYLNISTVTAADSAVYFCA
ncbi:HVM06 protein, partial [Atractosteus spatula]|nr:HVM06 protein [Atractosteus spatula]